MHDGLGLELREEIAHKVVVGQIADAEVQRVAKSVLPGAQAVCIAGDGQGAEAADFCHPVAPQQQIGASDLVPARAQMQCQGETQIAIDAGDEDSHILLPRCVRVGAMLPIPPRYCKPCLKLASQRSTPSVPPTDQGEANPPTGQGEARLWLPSPS